MAKHKTAKKKSAQNMKQEKHGGMAFSFGDPEPVLDKGLTEYLDVILTSDQKYYAPPVSFSGLARLRGANAYHGPLLEFKTNQILKDIVLSDAVTWDNVLPFATDFTMFMNAYFQKIKNKIGEVVFLRHVPAINMRRMKEKDRFCMEVPNKDPIEFKKDEILHVKNYDVTQTIYGIPSYLGAIQSMLLNEDATIFRRRYYLNGAHVGYIFYSSSADLGENERNSIRDAVKDTKKHGNFKNLFLHIPNGREKDVQILPVGDFATKDELEKIKNISRDDIIAAHRIPPALASIVPAEARGGFGDITKAAEVYMENEIVPLRRFFLGINDILPKNKHISFDEMA